MSRNTSNLNKRSFLYSSCIFFYTYTCLQKKTCTLFPTNIISYAESSYAVIDIALHVHISIVRF